MAVRFTMKLFGLEISASRVLYPNKPFDRAEYSLSSCKYGTTEPQIWRPKLRPIIKALVQA